MKKEKILNTLWFLLAIAVAIGVATFVYASTGLDRCYWSNIDSDFCYSVAGLRFVDGLPSGFVEHSSSGVGLPLVQLLGWTYALASKIGLLSVASFQGLASNPDPLLYLRQFVIAGWLSGAVIFLLTVGTVFWFARFLTGSYLISFFASLIVAVSWSNLQFLLRIREEAFSACMGLLSLYLVFKAARAARLSAFGTCLIGSGVALAFALFAKRNALPYLAFSPLVFLLTAETALDRAQAGARTVVLRYAFVANLFLAPPLVLLLRHWPEFIASFTLSLVPYLAVEILGFMLLLALWVFLISCVRLCKSCVIGQLLGLLKRGAGDAATYALLFMIGFELAVYASFLHPKVNAYTLFMLAVLIAGGVLVVAARRRGQSSIAAMLRTSPMRPLITANNGIIALAAIAWGALWQLARVSPEAFGAHMEVAVSRVLFEMVHPQSSISFLSSADHASPLAYLGSVGAEWWGHYRGSRWPELLIVALTVFELLLARRMRAVNVILFLVLCGMGLLFFSSLRHLFPFYVTYEDTLTILAVALCFSHLVGLLRSRVGGGAGAAMRVAIVFALAVYLATFSFMGRTAELRGVQAGAAAVGCSSPPSGDTCLCDHFYAGTKYGGTGLKGIIEQQYGSDCMQAVEARAVQGLP
jgi:hypothetical protein